MKYFSFLCLFLMSFFVWSAESTISGQVTLPEGCGKKAMVWLSLDRENYQERLLLLHTEVPAKGTFRFYVKDGDYQIRASDESGCEYVEKVKVHNKSLHLDIKLVKK